MAKKLTIPEKLKTEISLQKSKMKSLQILDQELAAKQQRLQEQRDALKQKYSKINFAMTKNQDRLNSLSK